MHSSIILTTLCAALATAAPHMIQLSQRQSNSTYYGVSIIAQVTSGLVSPAEFQLIPAPLNTLINANDISCSSLFIANGSAINVDIDSVECRAYKDVAGVEPGSAPFTLASPAFLTTNLVEVGSILCYATETS